MNELELFNYADQNVRVVMIGGEPWFIAVDVCHVLGIDHVATAVKRLNDDGVCQTHTLRSNGRPQGMTAINEANLYRLIFRSDKPAAEPFVGCVLQ